MIGIRKTRFFKLTSWLLVALFIFQADFLLYSNNKTDAEQQFEKAKSEEKHGEYQASKKRLDRLIPLLNQEKQKELFKKTTELLKQVNHKIEEIKKAEEIFKLAEADYYNKKYNNAKEKLCQIILNFKKEEIIHENLINRIYDLLEQIRKKLPKSSGKIILCEGKKKKKFPWLLVVGGVVIVAVVAVLLTKKKKEPQKYTLTVTKGDGVDGTPNNGTITYNESTTVNYNYSLLSGYKDLVVQLDGNAVSSNGTITMDRDHTLTALATPLDRYTLTVAKGDGVVGTPDNGATTYDEGTVVNYSYSLQSGYTNLEVKLDGATVPASGAITMSSNHTLTATAALAGDDPPSVSITQPQPNETVSGTYTIKAQAADDKGISKVEFYIDGSIKKIDNSSPYRYNWDTTGYVNGPHAIKVTAYDTNNQTNKDEISVSVNNYDYDITGTWKLKVYTVQRTIRYTWVFQGSKTEGNIYVASDNYSKDRGDYKVNGNQVEMTVYDDDWDNVGTDWKYTIEGKFENETNMSGNYIWENFNNGVLEEQETGKWDAEKQ